jgi:hypothetical protein
MLTQVSILEGREKQHYAQLQEQAAKTKEKAAELERLTKQLEVSYCCAAMCGLRCCHCLSAPHAIAQLLLQWPGLVWQSCCCSI